MYEEVILKISDLQRERWVFDLEVAYSVHLYFDSFVYETRETTRQKWVIKGCWYRLNQRQCTTTCPIIPLNVQAEVKKRFADHIAALLFTGAE